MRLFVTETEPLPSGRAPARPLFAIGDIHGHSDALEALLAHLKTEIETKYRDHPVDLVFLGDLVDRGPDPRGVLTLARKGVELETVRRLALLGNHDLYLRASAGLCGATMTTQDWGVWLANGGKETLAGLDGLTHADATPPALRAALGPENCAFLQRMCLYFETGSVLCVHAGVHPDRGLDEQITKDLLWIRNVFIDPASDAKTNWRFGRTVVHGHTPSAFGLYAHRIGVDSGGYESGIFSALELSEDGARFHHLARESAMV